MLLQSRSPDTLLNSVFSLGVILTSLIVLSGCSPHPASGNWVSSEDNSANFTKILVHFESRLEIFSGESEKPALYCGWSATSRQNIGIECLRSEDQDVMDVYQLNVEGEDKAELIQNGKVIARFVQLPEDN